jgi:hypothetical protein
MSLPVEQEKQGKMKMGTLYFLAFSGGLPENAP